MKVNIFAGEWLTVGVTGDDANRKSRAVLSLPRVGVSHIHCDLHCVSDALGRGIVYAAASDLVLVFAAGSK